MSLSFRIYRDTVVREEQFRSCFSLKLNDDAEEKGADTALVAPCSAGEDVVRRSYDIARPPAYELNRIISSVVRTVSMEYKPNGRNNNCACARLRRMTASPLVPCSPRNCETCPRRGLCGPRFLSSLTNAWIGCGFAARIDKRHFNAYVEVPRFITNLSSRRK